MFSTTLDCIIVLVVESIHLNCFIYFHLFIKIPEVLGLFALYFSVLVLIKTFINCIVICIYITFCWLALIFYLAQYCKHQMLITVTIVHNYFM